MMNWCDFGGFAEIGRGRSGEAVEDATWTKRVVFAGRDDAAHVTPASP